MQKFDSSTFAFWSKSSVDVVEPRRIRLQSNSYTTNTLLDTVTAHHTGIQRNSFFMFASIYVADKLDRIMIIRVSSKTKTDCTEKLSLY